jgi:broad specificity phosphatase PhoE
MHLAARLLCTFSMALSMLTPCVALADPTMIYLVRHGEKELTGVDPVLSAPGVVRAQNLATMLEKAGIKSIFSTPTLRAMQTAEPLARRSGLAVQTYDAKAPKALVEKVKSLSGAVLVVGHSNTLPELVRLFGGAPGADIADNEYDRLYQLSVGPGGAVTTVLLTLLPATGPAQ